MHVTLQICFQPSWTCNHRAANPSIGAGPAALGLVLQIDASAGIRPRIVAVPRVVAVEQGRRSHIDCWHRSTQEMWQAVAAVRQQVAAGELATADVSYEMIQQQLYTEVRGLERMMAAQMVVPWSAFASTSTPVSQLRRSEAADTITCNLRHHKLLQGCPPVDLMIRTSGETRLSDFLLPQSGHATLCFSTALWPDFSFLDMLSALTRFQRDAPTLQRNAYAAAQCSSADGRAQIGAQPSAAAAAAAACDNTQRHKTSAAADVTGRRPLEARPAAKAGDGGPTQLMQDRSSSSSSMTLVPVAACKQPAAAGQEPQPAHAATPAAAADRDGLAADAAVIPASLTTCRAASMGKASKRTSLQFDVVAISSAAGPTLIS